MLDYIFYIATFVLGAYIALGKLSTSIMSAACGVFLDEKSYYYIPFYTGGQTKVIKIRKPVHASEWAFVIVFVGTIVGLLYRLHNAISSKKKLEAKRRLVTSYKKYAKMGMFAILFPMACSNDANEIVEFCTHIANYYRTVTTLVDFGSDISSIYNDIFDEDDEKESKYHTQGKHDDLIDEEDELLSEDDSSDEDPVEERLVRAREESRRKFEEVMAQEAEAKRRLYAGETHFGLGYSKSYFKTPGVWQRLKSKIKVSFNNFTIFATSCLVKFRNFLVAYRWHLAYGTALVTTAGLLFHVFRSKPSKVTEGGKKKNRGGKKARSDMKHARDTISTAKPLPHRNSGGDDEDVMWRDREERREREREEADREVMNANEILGREYERNSEAEHALEDHMPISHYSNLDRRGLLNELAALKKLWFDKGQNESIKMRRERIKHLFFLLNSKFPKDKTKSKHAECVHMCDKGIINSSSGVCNIKCGGHNCTHWKECKPVPPKTWEPFAWVSSGGDEAYDRVTKKTEQLRPGFIPFYTPHLYLVRATCKNSVGYVVAFPYGNCLFVPRHGVVGCPKVCVTWGSKDFPLPDKCVIVRDQVDCVMYPCPGGVPQNKGMSFRAPIKGEIIVLFWIRSTNSTRVVQTVGKVGDTVYLGKDRKLKAIEFDSSSENGSCGGIYIASSDGYCVGIHGVGSEHVPAKPLFYPFSSEWPEKVKDVSQQTPTYLASNDDKYYKMINEVINNDAPLTSLNL